MPEDESQPFTGAVLYCPVCCTNDDAYQWGENKMTCNNCQTEYTVEIVPAIIAEHAMIG